MASRTTDHRIVGPVQWQARPFSGHVPFYRGAEDQLKAPMPELGFPGAAEYAS